METPTTDTSHERAIKVIKAVRALPEGEREEVERFMDLLLIENKTFQWLKENFVPTMKTRFKQRVAMEIDGLINAGLSSAFK